MRVSDTLDDVPVTASRRDAVPGPSRRDPEQAALRIELVKQAVEVVLVGAAAVVEDQRPGRIRDVGLADPEVDSCPLDRGAHAGTCLGLWTGVRFASTCARRCS